MAFLMRGDFAPLVAQSPSGIYSYAHMGRDSVADYAARHLPRQQTSRKTLKLRPEKPCKADDYLGHRST